MGIGASTVTGDLPEPWDQLEPSELRVLRLGLDFVLDHSEVARILRCDPRTVRRYRRAVVQKCGARWFLQACRMAHEAGVPPESDDRVSSERTR